MERMMTRSYTDLKRLETFDERYEYLRVPGTVGRSTFGYDRYLNQVLYTSRKWSRVRDEVIARDNGCDLGVDGYSILSRIIIHHMNPITVHDIRDKLDIVLDPEYLICVSNRTHLAIHYGDSSMLNQKVIVRKPGDTSPWLKG